MTPTAVQPFTGQHQFNLASGNRVTIEITAKRNLQEESWNDIVIQEHWQSSPTKEDRIEAAKCLTEAAAEDGINMSDIEALQKGKKK